MNTEEKKPTGCRRAGIDTRVERAINQGDLRLGGESFSKLTHLSLLSSPFECLRKTRYHLDYRPSIRGPHNEHYSARSGPPSPNSASLYYSCDDAGSTLHRVSPKRQSKCRLQWTDPTGEKTLRPSSRAANYGAETESFVISPKSRATSTSSPARSNR